MKSKSRVPSNISSKQLVAHNPKFPLEFESLTRDLQCLTVFNTKFLDVSNQLLAGNKKYSSEKCIGQQTFFNQTLFPAKSPVLNSMVNSDVVTSGYVLVPEVFVWYVIVLKSNVIQSRIKSWRLKKPLLAVVVSIQNCKFLEEYLPQHIRNAPNQNHLDVLSTLF